MDGELRQAVERIAGEIGLEAKLEQIWYSPPVEFAEPCVAAVRNAAQRLGYDHMDIISGAGHDACYVSRVAPTGMIFVPCEDGISHNEIENATKEDIGAGAQVLLHAMIERADAV
jgi:beta-ureidopropionase / N-carbamoyl-L-amino-acid hydrolase